MDINKNEALAYAQASKGVYFVRVRFVDRFVGDPREGGSKGPSRPTPRKATDSWDNYFYKVLPELKLKPKDLIVCQVLNTAFGICQVTEVLYEPPLEEEDGWDYSHPMKWALSKVDQNFSDSLRSIDSEAIRAITRASLKSRVRELNGVLGMNLSELAPLPSYTPRVQEEDEEDLFDGEDPTDETEVTTSPVQGLEKEEF